MKFKIALVALVTLASAAAQASVDSALGGDRNRADFIALTPANVSGGALLRATTPESTRPHGTAGRYLAVGPDELNNGGGDAMISFGSGVSQVSFEWGTPDAFNNLLVTEVNGDVTSFNLADVGLHAGGKDRYVTFAGVSGSLIKSLTFASTGNSFEAANFAVGSAPVPEPGSVALMLAGLGLFSVVARRRRG